MGTYYIGSDPGNQIVINNQFVSGRHAQINITPEGSWIADMGSTDGTLINGARITESVWLSHNDKIQLGNETTIRFQDARGLQVPPPATPGQVVPPKTRRWPSCISVFLILLLVSCCCVLLLGGGGYYLYQSGSIDPQSILIKVSLGDIRVANLSEGSLHAELHQIDAETGNLILYEDISLAAYDVGTIGSILPGSYEMRFTNINGNVASGSCWMDIKSGQVYQFAAVPQGIAVTLEGYKPTDPAEVDILTSSLCSP